MAGEGGEEGGGGEGETSPERLRRPSHQSVVVVRWGGGEGLLSPDRRRAHTLSLSGSAYSVESSGQSPTHTLPASLPLYLTTRHQPLV